MDDEELTPHLIELKRVLKNKIDDETLMAELKNYVNVYQIDIEKAKRGIIKKHGGSDDIARAFVTGDSVVKKIAELNGAEQNVDIVAKVVFSEKKTITVKGTPKTIISGTLGDETGTTQFTNWDGENCTLETGSVYRFKSAYTKLWNDRIQINFGSRTNISKENKDVEVKNISVTPGTLTNDDAIEKKINELTGTEQNVNVVAKVVFVNKKETTVRGAPRIIISGILGDETGTASFTLWNGENVELEKDKSYLFKGAYTRLWNDKVQINLGDRCEIADAIADIAVPQTMQQNPTFTADNAEEKKIGDLKGSEPNVNILGKVLLENKKDLTIKGAPRTIISGILGDETGTAPFTIWNAEDIEVEKGANYWFKCAYTRLWNSSVQINLGDRGSVEKSESAIEIPDRPIAYSSSEVKIGELREGIGNVTVNGKVLSVESKNIISKGEEKTVFSGILADDTGKVQFSAWIDFPYGEGDAICIKNGYIRSWKGIPQLNFGEKSEVSKIDDVFGDLKTLKNETKSIGEIVRNGGGIDLTVSGVIVDLRAGSGLIGRCPQCNRSIIGNDCAAHGTVEPVPDLRMKVVVDDGTGAISAILNRDITENLTGITLKIATDLAKARGDAGYIAKAMAEKIMLRHITIEGNVMSDEYGPSMIVKNAKADDVDVAKEAGKLLSEIEEAL